MVKICNEPYPVDSKYNSYFEYYPYPLSDFQKYAIEAIVEGNHALVTAHTGSGKTLPAEFALQHFVKKGKKVIYTSPIKALSNQKYYDFTHKYPDISFGLFTGDIKTNPDADVIIMTTEILMNALFSNRVLPSDDEQKTLQFQMDINTELGCVIFDEVHYINDADRGQVWEKTILMLPPHIQMVMLSATIDAPVRFAEWCERGSIEKQVYLASTNHRVVPLSHYGFLTTNEMIFKGMKDKVLEKQIRDSTNTLIRLQNEHGKFQESGFLEISKMMKIFDDRNAMNKRKMVLNNLALFLRDREMLPAIAFVFSRKHVEICASEITVPLLEDDSKIPYTIRRECEQIIRKLPNFREYYELPEYNTLVSLLEKGIGIHHSGMIPILREIVEIMISKKYIKLLFATESFAIGLDCPIKTAIFTSVTKFDGNGERYLLSHEYTQMAGRAGRRGIDTVGHVVHCNNLFGLPTQTEYKNILGGIPQKLVSKFRISYHLILNLLKNGESSKFTDFINKSMIYGELQENIQQVTKRIEELAIKIQRKEECFENLRTPIAECSKYLDLDKSLKTQINKKKREIEREIQKMKDEYRHILVDIRSVNEYHELQAEMMKEEEHKSFLETYIFEQARRTCHVLVDQKFIEKTIYEDGLTDSVYQLTDLGKIASNIAEIHPLIFTQMISDTEWFTEFSCKQLVAVFSCFTDMKVNFEDRLILPKTKDDFVGKHVLKMKDMFQMIENEEQQYELNTGIKYQDALMFDVIDEVMEWCDYENETDCKYFIQNKIAEKGISVGDFTKAMMKIATISNEIMSICEEHGKIELMHKLNKIEPMIMKYITTSQSLYV